MNFFRSSPLGLMTWVIALVVTLSSSPLYAQDSSPPPTQVIVFHLKNTKAQEVAETVKKLMSAEFAIAETAIVADLQTNTLVVRATRSAIDEIGSLLEAIDVASKGDDSTTTLIKRYLDSSTSDPKFLDKFAQMSNVEVALDSATGIVMIKGEKSNVKRFEAFWQELREQLQVPSNVNRSPNQFLRVVWLTSYPNATGDPKPMADDLLGVCRKLEKMGIEGLRPTCQLLAKTDGSQFEVTGSANFYNKLISLQVQGYPSKETAGAFQFQIHGNESPGNNSLFQMAVEANLVPGKMIVLASAPIALSNVENAIQSAFVVQLVNQLD